MKINKYLCLLLFCICHTMLYSQVGINTSYVQDAFIIDGKADNPANLSPNDAQADNDFVIAKNGNVGLGVKSADLSAKLNISSTNAALKNKGLIRLEGGDVGQVLGAQNTPGLVEWRLAQGIWIAEAIDGKASGTGTVNLEFNNNNLFLNTPSVGIGSIAMHPTTQELEIKIGLKGIYRLTLSGVSEISSDRMSNNYNKYFISGYFRIYKYDPSEILIALPHTIANWSISTKYSFGYTYVIPLNKGDILVPRMIAGTLYANKAEKIRFRVELMNEIEN